MIFRVFENTDINLFQIDYPVREKRLYEPYSLKTHPARALTTPEPLIQAILFQYW